MQYADSDALKNIFWYTRTVARMLTNYLLISVLRPGILWTYNDELELDLGLPDRLLM